MMGCCYIFVILQGIFAIGRSAAVPNNLRRATLENQQQRHLQGTGYCSNSATTECSTNEDCGCGGLFVRRLRTADESSSGKKSYRSNDEEFPFEDNHRRRLPKATKAECDDGTCRMPCGDCAVDRKTNGEPCCPTEPPPESPSPSSAPTVCECIIPHFPSESAIPSGIPSHSPSETQSILPSSYPSMVPSLSPTEIHSSKPSTTASSSPSKAHSNAPSTSPSVTSSHPPSKTSSAVPSLTTSSSPSSKPSKTASSSPSKVGSNVPSASLSTPPSSKSSSKPSGIPPMTNSPSNSSSSPSAEPSWLGDFPTQNSSPPSIVSSSLPSQNPSSQPSERPSSKPSSLPSLKPSSSQSSKPSQSPSSAPSSAVSSMPSSGPSSNPSSAPSLAHSSLPSLKPSSTSSSKPSSSPSFTPSRVASSLPSSKPSDNPSPLPSSRPSLIPSISPSMKPTSQPTKAPTKVPTSTLPLVIAGDNGSPSSSFPLHKCEGDCDSDGECQKGLYCFQRNASENVPGCTGEAEGSKDYCTELPSPNYLVTRGNNGSPPYHFPLGLCEGDCDNDSECDGSLVCFQRNGVEEIPGCDGMPGESGSDYCYDPNYLDPTPLPTPIPTAKPTVAPTNAPTQTLSTPPSATSSDFPSLNPTMQSSPQPSGLPSESTSPTKPNSLPSAEPSSPFPSEGPSSLPSLSPSSIPTKSPSALPSSSRPTLPPSYYQYTTSTTRCDGSGSNYNIQGPAPLPDKSNTALQFFAFGDTPYDDSCSTCNTCIGSDGQPVADCSDYDCTVSNSNMGQLEVNNTCTYEGDEVECLRESIIPYMNRKMDAGDAAFSVHVGDILKGNPSGGSRRCQDSSFQSRRDLFANLPNFLLVPGDNDWNECEGYDLNANTDWIRRLWRRHFAEATSPFHQFSEDFPLTPGQRPVIQRQDTNPENYYFEYNNVAVFGLNRVAGDQYVDDVAPTDLNAVWVAQQLSNDSITCTLKSIIVVSHILLSSDTISELNSYFSSCSVLPVLTITGNAHPTTYCMEQNNYRVDLTVEAFRSGPILVSVVRSPNGEDFFHVDDADLTNSNSQCPSFGQ